MRRPSVRTVVPFLIACGVAYVGPAAAVPAGGGGADDGRVSLSSGDAEIPAFARKYRVSCSLCHQPFPRLTEFGETFAGNGFQFAVDEEPRDTIDTGDPLLRLASDLPLAIRYEGFGQAVSDPDGGKTSNDLGFPWGVKLLTGGNLAPKVSWYLYFFFSERGEVAGLEDAYVQFSDIGSSGVSLLVGQFQVSDPLFKRELRLEFEDYVAYRVRVGDARADLTYDRGLMALWSPWEGGDLAFGVVNGQGLDEARDVRQFDRDAAKNVFARYSHSFGPLRLGGFGFFGAEEAEDVWNETWIFGPDVTFSPVPEWELNAQYLYRSDDRPFFGLEDVPTDTEVHAVLAEALWWPTGRSGRWTFSALYNLVDADEPVFNVRVGELTEDSPFVSTYSFGALGTSWLFARNLRLTGEVGWDFERDYARVTAGVVGAF
ncbi:MAG: hypothetical protein RRA92_09315 [Gemmatimonadota bacterium]|nr:hypothetical protein [Gemmatimonadota bacterium]